MPYDDGGWPAYVSVADRRRTAARALAKLQKGGHKAAPVQIEGRTIASTFWGKAWCSNLESYRDYESRLPRGRSYVRNGFVIDLQIGPREVKALVSGSSLYRVTVGIAPVPAAHWRDICADCAGRIDSLVELLQGRLSKGVMERICRQNAGLFPKPTDITFSCSCMDHASMCKHVAAVLYGVGARLDRSPELLFHMRAVNQQDLLAQLADAMPAAQPDADRILPDDDVSALFGLDMAESNEAGQSMLPPTPVRAAPPTAPRAVAAALSSKAKPAKRPAAPAPAKTPAANIRSIAGQLSGSSGLDKRQSEKLVADVVAVIADHLAAGTNVALAGLGTLAVSQRDVRTGRNPSTGEVIRLAGTKELVFRPTKRLRGRDLSVGLICPVLSADTQPPKA